MKRYQRLGLLVVVVSVLLAATGCEDAPRTVATTGGNQNTSSGPLRFAEDNDKVIYAACWDDSSMNTYLTVFVNYDHLKNQKRLILLPKRTGFATPQYSWDGKKIAFPEIQGNTSNICIMDADGSHFEQLTHDYWDGSTKQTTTGTASIINFNTMPSFSPDGKKIIYAKAGIRRERSLGRGKMLSKWDIYEIEIETKTVRRLTNFQFYDVSVPYYMPDGKRFVFWGVSPGTMRMDDVRRYQAQYKDNWIFIMDGKNNELKPAIVHGSWTCEPSVTRNGDILFIGKTNELDGLPQSPFNYDLFLMQNNKVTRITRFNRKLGHIYQATISPDGQKALLSASRNENGKSISRNYIANADGTNFSEIRKPKTSLDEIIK